MSGQRTQWNEATRVQMPALVHLTRIGFTYFGKITEDKAGTVYDPDTNILIEVFKSQFAKLNPERAGEAEAIHMLPSACAEFDETKRKSCDCTSNWFPHGKEQRRGQTAEAYCKRETCIWRYQYAVQCFCKYRYKCIRCVLR